MKNKPHVIIDIIFPRRADVQDDLNKRTIAELFEYAQNINNDNVHLYAFPSMIH